MILREAQRAEHGFTLVEVMVAATLLLVGLLGTVTMLDQANSTTFSTKAREQGVSLEREIIEAARAIPYDQMQPTSIVSRVQQTVADDNLSSPGWTVKRRGITYAVSLGVCSVDDPQDGNGQHDPNTFCPPGSAMTSTTSCSTWLGVTGSIQGTPAAATAGVDVGKCGIDLNLDGTVDNLVQASLGLCLLGICTGQTNTDTNPDDYKRVVALVRWDKGAGSRFVLQSTTLPNPGSAAAPGISALTAGAIGATSVPFTATAFDSPQAVSWLVDGTPTGNATGSGATWTFTWPIGTVNPTVGGSPNNGEVVDGSYVISAKAFDDHGNSGTTRAVTMALNRRQPYAPQGVAAGRNGGTLVDLEWAPNRERDLQGYRVYRGATVACALTVAAACQDTSAPATGSVDYYVVAVDKDSGGSLREGDHSATATAVSGNSPPTTPPSFNAVLSGGNYVLTWGASSDPNLIVDHVDFYRIYRDGTAFSNRYDRVDASQPRTYTDNHTNGLPHTYYVSAVDTHLAESAKAGPKP